MMVEAHCSSPHQTHRNKAHDLSNPRLQRFAGINASTIIEKCLAAGLVDEESEIPTVKKAPLDEKEVCWLCNEAKRMFSSQPLLLELTTPMKVVGDIHGQFDDLLTLIDHHGPPASVNYLFMGNYVDYGSKFNHNEEELQEEELKCFSTHLPT
jgi:hypothetical protein